MEELDKYLTFNTQVEHKYLGVQWQNSSQVQLSGHEVKNETVYM